MRLVIQRVSFASVSVEGKVVGEINNGLFILVGVAEGDTGKMAELLAEKVSKLRIMADEAGKMNLSVQDVKASILVVSQFTLYSDVSKGNRPSFISAAQPESAEKVYNHFVAKLSEYGINTKTGSFGKYMNISASLDGPVTITIEI